MIGSGAMHVQRDTVARMRITADSFPALVDRAVAKFEAIACP